MVNIHTHTTTEMPQWKDAALMHRRAEDNSCLRQLPSSPSWTVCHKSIEKASGKNSVENVY